MSSTTFSTFTAIHAASLGQPRATASAMESVSSPDEEDAATTSDIYFIGREQVLVLNRITDDMTSFKIPHGDDNTFSSEKSRNIYHRTWINAASSGDKVYASPAYANADMLGVQTATKAIYRIDVTAASGCDIDTAWKYPCNAQVFELHWRIR